MRKGTKPLLFARPLVSVPTDGVGVGNAHIASLIRAGSGVPLPRAGALTGIDLTRNVIGRRTGARGIDDITARRSRGTGRATVGATGIFSRRGVGWSPRSVALAHITRVDVRVDIGLCIRLRDPRGRSQNDQGCDSHQCAFDPYLP